MGWAGVKNGELLAKAAADRFVALVTMDAGFEHQHDQTTLPVPVVIMKARSNRVADLVPLCGGVLDAIASVKPRSVTIVEAATDEMS